MKDIKFVIGGCRSGKSSHALKLAELIPGKRRTFIATCVPHDDEMRERVVNHQAERGEEWDTVEAPLYLPEAIIESSLSSDVVLADCLTLWVSNLMMEFETFENIKKHVEKLVDSLGKASCPVILVSNEVGTGIVPENKLARLFRDIVGFTNQKAASVSDNVIWMVAGIPVNIKPQNF